MANLGARNLGLLGITVAIGALAATPVNAQATRTWVSGVGDDVNPCSRTAPCKTFAGAISKTAAGGEINCLDPGGFGAVSINKSLTISCPYTEGGALAGGNGITVNLPASTDVVFLRGLDIFGVNPPSNGVRFVGTGSLHIEDSVIRRFNAANSTGVSFAPSSGTARLYISNTTIATNGNGATGGGIEIRPTGTGVAKALIKDSRILGNANNGLRIDTAGTSAGGTAVTVENSSFSGNTTGISVNSGTVVTVMVNGSTVVNNTGTGIAATGASSSVAVGNTTITGNAVGVSASGGSAMHTFDDNRNQANPDFAAPNNGTFTQPPLTKD